MKQQYIDKSIIIAEIDRRIQFFMKSNSDIAIALYGLRSFLDSLETKEIDIEKEAKHYLLNDSVE